jgi:magnesium transporter|tara:strand:- start:1679 stop:2074 length:396 start_codon:yes stop_codon:yes gene_type:complete
MDSRHLEDTRKELSSFEESIFNDEEIDTMKFFALKKTLIDNRAQCHDLLDLHDILESIIDKRQNDKINRRLNMLTIWSTLFLPLSFFTGLFGMNFNDIPFLNSHYGFWIFVVLSLITVGGLWYYFKKYRWF